MLCAYLTTMEKTDGLHVGKCSLSKCESNGFKRDPDEGVPEVSEAERTYLKRFFDEPVDDFNTALLWGVWNSCSWTIIDWAGVDVTISSKSLLLAFDILCILWVRFVAVLKLLVVSIPLTLFWKDKRLDSLFEPWSRDEDFSKFWFSIFDILLTAICNRQCCKFNVHSVSSLLSLILTVLRFGRIKTITQSQGC